MFGAYFVVFVMTALALYKGTKIIGKLSYVMAVLPYLIMVMLFGRAVTLKGAEIGIKYYLTEWKFEKLYDLKVNLTFLIM